MLINILTVKPIIQIAVSCCINLMKLANGYISTTPSATTTNKLQKSWVGGYVFKHL